MTRKRVLTQKLLKRAHQHRDYIRIHRVIKKADEIDGYVVDLGRRWVLLYAPSEGSPSGYVALPIRDIRRIGWAPGGRFVRRSLKDLAAWPPVPPPESVDLKGPVPRLVESVAAISPFRRS